MYRQLVLLVIQELGASDLLQMPMAHACPLLLRLHPQTVLSGRTNLQFVRPLLTAVLAHQLQKS